jgi:molecular chaperone IbpA
MTGLKNIFPRSSFVGFDHMFNELDHISQHANDYYPPHNVIKVGDQEYLIELAIAGFSKNEIEVALNDRTLTITGEHVSRGREFIHRGISTKKFKRSFRLSEHVEVHGADVVDGILAVQLKYVVPDNMRPRLIPIGNPNEVKSNEKQFLQETN